MIPLELSKRAMPTKIQTIIIHFVFSLIGPASLIAQIPNDGFVSGSGRFAVATTDKAFAREDKNLTISKYDLSGQSITWKFAPGVYTEVQQYVVYGEQARPSAVGKRAILAGLT